MAGRFVKLYDKILKWEWFTNPNTLQLFLYILLKANYRTSNFQGISVKRGQLLTSLSKLCQATGQTTRQIRDNLKHLEMTGEVTSQTTNRYRIITVVRYDDYQHTDKQNDKQNDKQLDKQMTSKTTIKPTTYIEYIEDIEEDRNIESLSTRERGASRFTPPAKEEVFDFCLAEGIGIDVDRFFDYYTANGWKVGRSPMRDWKAACRNWARRDKEQQPSRPASGVKRVIAQEYEQRDYNGENDEAMRRMLAVMREAAEP